MGKDMFSSLRADGGKIFQAISDNMSGYDSDEVPAQVARWEAVVGELSQLLG